MTKEEYEDFRSELLGYGYQPYIDAIDAEVGSEYPCSVCGGKNVYGEGLKKDKSYYAFAVCPDCGHTEDF